MSEFFDNQVYESITLPRVGSLEDLIDPRTKQYFMGEVNVLGSVNLSWFRLGGLSKLPVRFGTVGGTFNCGDNKLTSLEGAPRYIGSTRYVSSDFVCDVNNVTSLEGIHKIVKKIDGCFWMQSTPIKSGGIGLLLIEGIIIVSSHLPAFKIINKYLRQGKKGLLRCQEELIEAGYEEYARL